MRHYKISIAALLLSVPLTVAADTDTRLIKSVKNGDQADVKVLLQDRSVDVNAAMPDGSTALHWAVHRDDPETVAWLLQSGADASPANIYKVTPLHLACTNRSDAMVEKLVQAGADAKAALWTGETALMECSRTGAVRGVAALIAAGADVNAGESTQGQTALMWAAGMGYSAVVKLLIEHGADVNSETLPTPDKVPNTCRICSWKPNPGGYTPLMFAARAGDVETIRLLVEAGADPDAATMEDGNTLVIASASGHEAAALLLLQSGADPASTDDNGVTALHYAFYNGLSRMHGYTYDPVYRVRPQNMPNLARALLEAGADPNARIARNYTIGPEIRSSCESIEGAAGATAFLLAAASADAPMLSMLARFEADPNITMEDGTTALIAAVRSACTLAHQRGDNTNAPEAEQALEAVKSLMQFGQDVNLADRRGNTALHMAAFSGTDTLVEFLLQNGASINVANKGGETPWSMASGISPSLQGTGSYGKHDTTAALLLKHGAEQIARVQVERDQYTDDGNISIIRDPEAGDVGIGK